MQLIAIPRATVIHAGMKPRRGGAFGSLWEIGMAPPRFSGRTANYPEQQEAQKRCVRLLAMAGLGSARFSTER